MNAIEILAVYQGSDGEATKTLYAKLLACGYAGVVAMNLFRACKASERAKVYRGSRYRGAAYDKKSWSIGNLCAALAERPLSPAITWGWAIDERARSEGSPHHHVIYIDVPTGQVSFHNGERGAGPGYAGEWDGAHKTAPDRICRWCADVLAAALVSDESQQGEER